MVLMDDDDGIVVTRISRAQILRHPGDNVITTAVDPNVVPWDRRETWGERSGTAEPVLHARHADPDDFIDDAR